MRSVFRHAFVWLLALSFVGSGAAWRHCMAAQATMPVQQVPASATEAHHAHHAASSHHHGADHGDHHHHAADDPGQPNSNDRAANDHTCGKCCSICTVSAAMPPAAEATIFTVSSVVFACDRDHCTGNTIRVDPGIPKRIV